MTPVYTKRIPTNWSVSQIETYLDCARKHFFKSVLRLPDPSNEAAQRGTKIHTAAENTGERLEKGVPLTDALDKHTATDAPWMSYVRALAGAGVLPNPGESHAREYKFSIPTHTKIPLIGKIDQILDERKPIDLADWKSTSDIRYAKTPLELTTNLQLNVYAHEIFQHVQDDIVRARLVYVEAKKQPLKTKLPRVVNVHVDLDREHVRRIWQGELPFGDQTKDYRLPRVLDEMLDTATNCDDFNDVTPTTTTCTKYGGCPFRTQCGLSPFAGAAGARNSQHEPLKRISIQESYDMGMLSGKNNGTNSNGPTKIAAPQTASAAAPTKSTGFLARAAAAKGGAVAKPTEVARQAKLDKDFPPAGVPTGVVPPDAPSRMTPATQDEVSASPVVDEAAEAPKKRGRPKKDVQVEIGEEDSVPAPRRATGAAKGFVLMIDCYPTKGQGGVDPTHLDDFFSTIEMELNELAATEENLPSFWLLPFGGQKAALAMKVQERIAKGLPPVMVVRSSSNAAREVMPFLRPHATQIIESIR